MKTIRMVDPVAVLPGDFLERLANAPEPPMRFAEEGEEPNRETDLELWIIHNRLTSDHPGYYVLRRQWAHEGVVVVDRKSWRNHDIEPLREMLIRRGLYCQPHQPGDPFTVEETWL